MFSQPGDFVFKSVLSGKPINDEISHFVRNDNQYFRFLNGVDWRLRRQSTPFNP